MREYEVNNRGNLVFGGCDTVALAKEYGTPLYVIDEEYLRAKCREIRETFLEKYPDTKAVYASKALQTLEVCRVIKEEGLGFDTVSGGEVFTALKAGVEPETMVFHGNNKTLDEIEFAVKNNVGRFVVDNEYELENIGIIAKKLGKTVKVQIRITPGIDSHTHEYISTAKIDSKFGVFCEGETRDSIIGKAIDNPSIELMGFHCHVGSQLMDNQDHMMALPIVLNMVKEVNERFGFAPSELNLGGGFGIRYVDSEQETRVADFTDPMMEEINGFFAENKLPVPTIYIEPGRWIAGNAGITLYTVGSIKEIKGIKTYLAVDGGMPDNPRKILYGAEYEAVTANRAAVPANKQFSIVGKCCESGDVLIDKCNLAENTVSGDILAVFATGAYNYSMASNYNRVPRPALVMVKSGKARLSVRRETYEDMILREI